MKCPKMPVENPQDAICNKVGKSLQFDMRPMPAKANAPDSKFCASADKEVGAEIKKGKRAQKVKVNGSITAMFSDLSGSPPVNEKRPRKVQAKSCQPVSRRDCPGGERSMKDYSKICCVMLWSPFWRSPRPCGLERIGESTWLEKSMSWWVAISPEVLRRHWQTDPMHTGINTAWL